MPGATWATGAVQKTYVWKQLSRVVSAHAGWGQASETISCAAWKALESQAPLGCGPYLVPAQGCQDESVLTHNAVRELLLSILILSCSQGHCELGELGLTELSERNYLLSVSR